MSIGGVLDHGNAFCPYVFILISKQYFSSLLLYVFCELGRHGYLRNLIPRLLPVYIMGRVLAIFTSK